MDINLSISAAPAITDKIAIRIYKTTSPNVVASMQEFSPPHSSPRNISFTDLDPGTYIVNTYETVGDPVIGTLRHSFIYDPTFQSADIKTPEFLKMNEGDTEYTDAAWAGYTIDIIFRNAFGPMFSPEQYNLVLNGSGQTIGFQLSQPGDQFGQDEQVVVTFAPKIVTVSPVLVSAKIITGETVVSADATLAGTDAGKLLRLQGAASFLDLKLPAIGSIDPFSMFFFVSDGGAHIMAGISVNGGGNINLFGNRTDLYLAQGERATILYTGADYVVLNDCQGPLRVGDIIDQYDNDSTVQGCVFANGTLLDRAVYKRLWEYVQQLDSSLLISDATWLGNASNSAKYSTGDGVNTFRIPRLYTDGYARGVDGVSRLAGSHQDDAVLTHEHEQASGLISPTNFGQGVVSRNRGLYNGSNTGVTDLTGPPVDTAGASIGASENTTNNFGVYKLIRI